MTDLSFSHTNYTTSLVDSLVGSTSSSIQSAYNSVPYALPAEEEDYTIKCICDFQEDDGNTVFCEKCETWQHIECYYHQKNVPDVHNCADCGPRPLDARRATERQRRRREQIDLGDRKVKKPGTKSHKKKIKAHDHHAIHTNGWPYDRHDLAFHRTGSSGSPRDQPPPAKKPKTSHRASNSMHSQAVPPNSMSHVNNRSTSGSHSLHSPSKTSRTHTPNGYHIEPYSLEFLQLYEDDPGDAHMQANLFNDIAIASSLSLWSDDVEALTKAANGRTPQDIFLRCDQPLDSMNLPQLNKVIKQDESHDYDGLYPRWTYLTIETFAPQNSIVGELRGKVGHMQDYVQDSANRWEYLRHPVPFVFFHPKLPIYIDTRREGTSCRYLRRSCRPNLSMKTILENGSDYHFCFVANQDLEAGTELTIGWVLDEHMRKYFQKNNDTVKQEGVIDPAESYVTDWVGKVLADFGGCACDDPNACSMAVYDRRNITFSVESAMRLSHGKLKKGRRSHNHMSPHSTGQATNSRSGSEALKHQDEEEQEDSRSCSGSLKSKSRSRDMTPARLVPADSSNVPGLELSDREKRKIAALEKNFEQLEQDKHQPTQKKKKRTSGGSTLSTPTAAASVRVSRKLLSRHPADTVYQKQLGYPISSTFQPATPDVSVRPRYVDSGTARRQSGSPAARSPLALSSTFPTPVGSTKTAMHSRGVSNAAISVHKNYSDASMQTDPETTCDWFTSEDEDEAPPMRKPFMSLTKRLLRRCHQERVKKEEARSSTNEALITPGSGLTHISTPRRTLGSPPGSAEIVLHHSGEDAEMHDIGAPSETPPPLSFSDLPVQKPRPPDDETKITDGFGRNHAIGIKTPPPPWPVEPLERKQPLNGYRTADLRVQLPPKQVFSSNAPLAPTIIGTPTSITSSFAQSPFSQTPSSYPPLFAPSTSSGFVQPSPAKKKISIGAYMSRLSNSKVETPTTATPDRQQQGTSPTMQHNILKPLASLSEEVRGDQMEDVANTEAPRKDFIDTLSNGNRSKSDDNPG
ncbi:hypothetical protein MMC24_001630 [Lignoscripta atroalba]|nr:hypothetical protein [Lignoscripta atroalba]